MHRLRALMYPSDQTVFVYQMGSEYAPDDPFGLEVLSLTTVGRLLYTHQHRGQVWQQQINVEPHVQDVLKLALAEVNTAYLTQHKQPPGASLVQIRYGDQHTSVDYHQGKTLPGYAQIIQLMDAYVQVFRHLEK